MISIAIYSIRGIILLVFFIVIVGNSAFAESDYVPGEILVRFKDTSPSKSASINRIHSYVGSLMKKDFKKLKIQHMKLPEGISVEDAIQLYRQDPNVEYAEPNYIVRINKVPDTNAGNDPGFDNLWGLHNTGQTVNAVSGTADADIDAPEAWDLTTGDTSVVIAVVDTGISYDHPDLSANMWTNSGETDCNDGIDNDGNGYIDDCNGWDFLSEDNDPADYHGHGTHVAGTIAAVGDNHVGVTGVMWKAKIMPLRFIGILGSGATSDAVEAILYANANGAHVINISWGGGGFSKTLKDALDVSSAVVVCAAGNGGSDGIGDNNDSTPYYPATYTRANIIAVAATDSSDTRASFSNYGATSVDLAAPGKNIFSTIPARETVLSDNFDDGNLNNPDWTTGGTFNTWAASNQYSYSGSYSLTDSPFAHYGNNTNSWSQSLGFSLAGKTGCKVSYRMRLLTLANDWLHIELSVNQSVWTTARSYSGTTNGSFTAFTEDLSNYEGEATTYIRFRLESDASGTSMGASIDDVEVTCLSDTYGGVEYEYFQGTSMATPHVSGVAGLILARNSSLENYQVKALILNNVDEIASLTNIVLTGGRLNAFGAVSKALNPETPTSLAIAGVSSASIDLAWTDNSANENGFKIERKWEENGEFSELASVGENITAYSDSNIEHSKTYHYRVRAFGGILGNFEYSNEVNATTPAQASSSSGGGGCFIATAAFGSPIHPYVKELRLFRDMHLLTNKAGKVFVSLYYKYSPPFAEIISGNDHLKFATRIVLTTVVMAIVYPYWSLSLVTAFIIVSIFIFMRKRK